MQQETLLRLARYFHVILPGLLVADAVHNAFVVHNLWQDRRKVSLSHIYHGMLHAAHDWKMAVRLLCILLTSWVSSACGTCRSGS